MNNKKQVLENQIIKSKTKTAAKLEDIYGIGNPNLLGFVLDESLFFSVLYSLSFTKAINALMLTMRNKRARHKAISM